VFHAGVWIAADDVILDGRVMRSPARIMMFEPPPAGLTSPQARDLAAALQAAADALIR
jgi:hypothetical protein